MLAAGANDYLKKNSPIATVIDTIRKIVEHHSGSNAAQSVPGEETTFVINLPKTHISSKQ